MKIKMLKIFTIIASAYLVLSAISGTIIQFPKYLVLSRLVLLNLQLIPLSTSILKLLLAVFVTLKVLIPKQKLLLKIASIPVAIAGITQIILVISYLRMILSYISSNTQINLLLTNLQLADLIFKIIFSLFVIFISIHTFRPFLKNNISLLITSFIIFAIFTLNVAINIFFKGPILMPTISYIITYASLFSVCYYALRREDLETDGTYYE